MNDINKLKKEMIIYYAGDAKRIQHSIKVHSFAKMIGELEQLPGDKQEILEVAALVHDIGIKVSEEKYGNCNGTHQEEEGPALAETMLVQLRFAPRLIERVAYLVGHHHTYTQIDGLDYQILVEADFLVNIYEDDLDEDAAKTAYDRIFKTTTGKEICRAMFL